MNGSYIIFCFDGMHAPENRVLRRSCFTSVTIVSGPSAHLYVKRHASGNFSTVRKHGYLFLPNRIGARVTQRRADDLDLLCKPLRHCAVAVHRTCVSYFW